MEKKYYMNKKKLLFTAILYWLEVILLGIIIFLINRRFLGLSPLYIILVPCLAFILYPMHSRQFHYLLRIDSQKIRVSNDLFAPSILIYWEDVMSIKYSIRGELYVISRVGEIIIIRNSIINHKQACKHILEILLGVNANVNMSKKTVLRLRNSKII